MTRFDKTSAPKKEVVHDLQYRFACIRVQSSALVISGPAVMRHIKHAKRIARTPKAQVVIIEQSTKVYVEMSRRFDTFTSAAKKNVSIINGDVYSHKKAYRFEDLDLCKSLKNTLPIIWKRLNEQAKKKKGNKCMMFTTCMRMCKTSDDLKMLNYILSIIGAELDLSKISTGKECRMALYKPPVSKRGRLVDLRITTYRDGSQMRSCVIIYK